MLNHSQFSYTHVLGQRPGQRIGIVAYLESGYYATNLDSPSMSTFDVDELVRTLNNRLYIPEDVAEAMTLASHFGWRCPAAAPALRHFWSADR